MKKHYFLFAALVIYQKDKLERNKPLNILITSDEQIVTRTQLGRAQQQAQVRFVTEFDPEGKAEIKDVFMQSVSYLGLMDEKTFHGEFYEEPAERTEALVAANDAETMPTDTDFAEVDQAAPEASQGSAEFSFGVDPAESDPRFGADDAGKQAQDRGE